MATRGFVLYLLSGFSIAIVSAFFIATPFSKTENPFQISNQNSVFIELKSGSTFSTSVTNWPSLEFNWRLVVATIIGFLGSAFGTVGGVGGGGIFVPMLTLVIGFDTKSAAALSKCMIMGASASSVWYNIRVLHPTKDVPILDYDLALLFQPMLMLGITVGVGLSVVFPYWLITILIIILFLGTSSRSFFKGIEMWKEETILKKEEANHERMVNSCEKLLIDTVFEPLIAKEAKTTTQIIRSNLMLKNILVLVLVWAAFLLLQIVKNDVTVCSKWYWVLFCLQFPVTFVVFGFEATKLYKENKKRVLAGNKELICQASIPWTGIHLAFCALCGILGGTVGGLLGSGGGFILGPLLLEIGVIPQVASATATFVMLFSSSLSVVEFYLLKRFPVPYALYLISVSIMAGFWGQYFVRKLIACLRRASIIVFILSAVIFASALTMGVVGIENSMAMINDHEFMGFLPFCDSQ